MSYKCNVRKLNVTSQLVDCNHIVTIYNKYELTTEYRSYGTLEKFMPVHIETLFLALFLISDALKWPFKVHIA